MPKYPFLLILLSGCARPIHGMPPTYAMASHYSLNDAAACLVREIDVVSATLTSEFAQKLGTADRVVNQIRIMQPNGIMEVLPAQPHMQSLYFVRVYANGTTASKFEIYVVRDSFGDFAEQLKT